MNSGLHPAYSRSSSCLAVCLSSSFDFLQMHKNTNSCWRDTPHVCSANHVAVSYGLAFLSTISCKACHADCKRSSIYSQMTGWQCLTPSPTSLHARLDQPAVLRLSAAVLLIVLYCSVSNACTFMTIADAGDIQSFRRRAPLSTGGGHSLICF